jgi:hypothetical protein
MLKLFVEPEQLIKKETSECLTLIQLNRLKLWGGLSLLLGLISGVTTLVVGINLIGGVVTLLYLGFGLLLVASSRSIIFDLPQQQVIFSTRIGPFERRTRRIPFVEIDSIYLDYEEHNFTETEQIERRWFIFLVLKNQQTATLAYQQAIYAANQAPNLLKQTSAWENLAMKICTATGKLLVRTPTVPSRTPHTFVGVIDQIVQRRLAALPPTDPLTQHTIRLRSHHNGSLEIVVDGTTYQNLDNIADEAVRQLVQASVEEWHAYNPMPRK